MEVDPTLLGYDYMNGMPVSALGRAADPIGPSAAAAAFDRATYLTAGGFDEGMFAYWEDVDLVLRMLAEGAAAGSPAMPAAPTSTRRRWARDRRRRTG